MGVRWAQLPSHIKRPASLDRGPSKLELMLAEETRSAKRGGGKRRIASEEHDDQVVLFRDWIGPYLAAGAVAYSNANGGWRGWKAGKALRQEGVTAGVPDITIIHEGRVYYLELKKRKGPRGGMRGAKIQESQVELMPRLMAAGAYVAVCHGIDEAVEQLLRWRLLVGVVTKRRSAA